MIVCATLKEAEGQRQWLGLTRENSVPITSPKDIERLLKGRASELSVVYVALSASEDLLPHIANLVYYLGLRVETIY